MSLADVVGRPAAEEGAPLTDAEGNEYLPVEE